MTAAALDAIEKDYQDHFANRPRFTRSLEKLDELIGRVTALTGLAGEDAERAQKMAELYRSERATIAELQAGGAHASRAHRANALANALTRRYARHYAGKNRLDRDLEMLRELADRIDIALATMNEAAKSWDHKVFAEARVRHQQMLEAARTETAQIPAAMTSPATAGSPGDQARALAQRANAQFRWYRLAFAGRDRSSRRLPLLDRMIRELEGIQAAMRKLVADGLQDATHAGNIGIVESQLITWRNERVAILNARPRLDPTGLFGALAAEANGLFDRYRNEYRGKPRKDVAVEGLEEICDSLLEVAMHMDEIDRIAGTNAYEKNLATVLENLTLYEREIDAVKAAKAA